MRLLPCLLVVFCLARISRVAAAEESGQPAVAEQETFFEQKIRPILTARCLECHGEKKQEAGLRLDSRAALAKGGDSGPTILDDKPDDGLILRVINHQGDIKMPPAGKLPDDEIAALESWVKQGAVFPQSDAAAGPSLGFMATPDGIRQSQATHWSYQPIARPALPQTRNVDWLHNPVDAFVLSRLESAGLPPAPAADRRTLLRRITFDLIGLPPAIDDVRDFENDAAPDAFNRAVDRLLASPHYGERWGRHWLDIARYADTKGYVFTEERKYPFSYTYRDYVIDAFNRDIPFDQFVLEQLAADQLEGDKSALAAMGFLTVGRRFGNNQNDIIDDRIDVVSRGLLGLTVGCARCHDHKYDAIPTDDYYSLYGIFASSLEPKELPQLGLPADIEAYRVYEEELQRRQTAVQQYQTTAEGQLRDELRTQAGLYLAAALHPETVNDKSDAKPLVLKRWQDYLAATAKEPHPVFGPWHALSQLPVESFTERAAAAIVALNDAADAQPRTNAAIKQALQRTPLATMDDVAKIYGELLVEIQTEWVKARDAGAMMLPDAAREEVRQVLYADQGPITVKEEDLRKLLGRDKRNELTKLKRAVESFQATSPGAPPRAMVMNDAPQPTAPHVFIRGNPGRPGKEVPRQFLQVLARESKPFQQGSGRLELARAVIAPENPLTARVIVNRVWQQHFGKGLVRTASDFGVRGEHPSHPELLDYLAGELVTHGWSLKAMHRKLFSSAVFQQVSDDRAEGQQIDPENRLLWKMNRRRLEFEPWRDALFSVADQLDDRLHGRPVDLFAQPFVARRAIYGFIDRQDLPGTFRVFDFASPDVSTAQRAETTVPQQLLYGMNSPLVIEEARHLAGRVANNSIADPSSAIQALYQRVYTRSPSDEELRAAQQFLQAATADADGDGTLKPLEQLAQGLLLANEFVFID